MGKMIIKGLFRRYERWNPVHPTMGAFSGMGFGLGCGVGWGPGFGPEVVGYVGSGCGVGFSVGFTVAGFGIGLPANYIYEVPYNGGWINALMLFFVTAYGSAVIAAKSISLESGWFSGLPFGGWNQIAPQVSLFREEADRKLSSFKQKHLQIKTNLFDMNIPSQCGSALQSLQAFGSRLLHQHKGPKD